MKFKEALKERVLVVEFSIFQEIQEAGQGLLTLELVQEISGGNL